ncbi:MAG: AbrB/MazE/SpoVT family DNA-binding domain-containing protein [Armatimonadetes bacterium]|nr:AbrB/MazE/SpoVT family DNA-binding domain-containing protein [Armatimonadota bacterium]
MRAKIARWGNSLALRVPKPVAEEAGLAEGAVVELTAGPSGLQVSPVDDEVPPLDILLAQVTAANRHEAVETGTAIGREVW